MSDDQVWGRPGVDRGDSLDRAKSFAKQGDAASPIGGEGASARSERGDRKDRQGARRTNCRAQKSGTEHSKARNSSAACFLDGALAEVLKLAAKREGIDVASLAGAYEMGRQGFVSTEAPLPIFDVAEASEEGAKRSEETRAQRKERLGGARAKRFTGDRDARLVVQADEEEGLTRAQRRALRKEEREKRLKASERHRASFAKKLRALGQSDAAPVAVPHAAFRKGRAVSKCADAEFHRAVCATFPNAVAMKVALWVARSTYDWGHQVVGRHLGFLVAVYEMARPSTRTNVLKATVGVSRKLIATCLINPTTGKNYSFETIKNSVSGSIAWARKLGLLKAHQPPAHAVPASMKGPPREGHPDGFAFNIYNFPEALWAGRCFQDGRHLSLWLRQRLLPTIWGEGAVELSLGTLPEAREEDVAESLAFSVTETVGRVLAGWEPLDIGAFLSGATGPPAPS